MIGWGIYYAFIKPIVAIVGWYVPIYIFLATFPLIALIAFRQRKTLAVRLDNSLLFIFIASVVLTGIAEASYNIAVQTGNVSSVAPIAGSYPALFVAISAMVFKERMHGIQWIGVGMAVVGIIVLGFQA